MLYVALSLCAMICTFFLCRFFATKTRLVEKTIDETIARKLATSPLNNELGHSVRFSTRAAIPFAASEAAG